MNLLHRLRNRGSAPAESSELTTEEAQAQAYRELVTALQQPRPLEPRTSNDIAVRIGPFVERAHPRPGDDHGPTAIAVALVPPNGRRHPPRPRYGWLRCETRLIIGVWQPIYELLTHEYAGLELPDQPLPPAHYAVHIHRPGQPLLRLGPYTQCDAADYTASRLQQHAQQAGLDVTAEAVPFDVRLDAHDTSAYQDPAEHTISLLQNLLTEQEQSA